MRRIKGRYIILLSVVLVIILIIASQRIYVSYFYPPLKPGPVVDIDVSAVTIKQLLPYVTNYMNDYKNTVEAQRREFSKSSFHFSRVDATLDKDQRGSIIFTMVEDKDSNDEEVFHITIDTNQHKILSIEEDESRYGDPHSLDIENWKIDSGQAIDMIIQFSKKDKKEIKYDKIHMLAAFGGIASITGERDYVACWNITLVDSSQNPEYYYPSPYIDPYTGKYLQGL